MNKNDLNPNRIDIITSGVSSAVGAIPYIGGFMSEIVHNVIPNQREDRIVQFILEINDELEKMKYSLDDLSNKFENLKYATFTYNCIRSVVNDVYDEKTSYYKNLCIDALTNNEKNLIRCERVLKILCELDYYEILYLKYYSNVDNNMTKEMENIISKLGFKNLQPRYYINMNEEQMDEETYKQITLNNLCNTGLLQQEVKFSFNGKSKHISYKITMLGNLILKKINI